MAAPPIRSVFLSYTSRFARFPEKQSFTLAAKAAVERVGYYCSDMTSFGAKPHPPRETCEQRVADADIYVGVFGPFFGTPMPDDAGRSYTILEYDTAVRLGKPRLIFLLSDEFAWPLKEQREPDAHHAAQAAFLERVRASQHNSWEVFADPSALDKLVFQALAEYRTQADMTALKQQLAEARAQLARLSAPPQAVPVLDDGAYLPMARVLCRSGQWGAVSDAIAQTVAKLGRERTAGVFARLFFDPVEDPQVRLGAAPCGEQAASEVPTPITYPEWVRQSSTNDPHAFALQTFRLIGHVRPANKTQDRPAPPDEVIALLLALLTHPDSPAALSAARALYVYAGTQNDWSSEWKPPHADDIVRRTLTAALAHPRIEPLCARYLLHVLSRCRDVSGEADLAYELAFALDREANPSRDMAGRIPGLEEESAAVAVRHLASDVKPTRWAAALCLARYGCRAAIGPALCEMVREDGRLGAASQDEIWTHLAWLDDPELLPLAKAAINKRLTTAGRLAVAWLLRRSPLAPEAVFAPTNPLRGALARDLGRLRELFAARAALADEAAKEKRYLNSPSGRQYGEAGEETGAVCRSRPERNYLVRGNDITGRPAWYFVQIAMPARDRFEPASRRGQLDLREFGTILRSGYGEHPPDYAKRWMKDEYGFEG